MALCRAANATFLPSHETDGLLRLGPIDDAARIDPERDELFFEHLVLPEGVPDELRLEQEEPVHLEPAHLLHEVRQVLHPEAHVPCLVALVVRHQIGEHRFETPLPHLLEDGERDGLHHELHAEELRGDVVRLEHVAEQRLRRRIEALRHVAELLQVVVHGVEVPGLVVRLAGGRHLRLERLEPIGELRGDLPRGELAPENDREEALQRLPFLRIDVHPAVLLEEHR